MRKAIYAIILAMFFLPLATVQAQYKIKAEGMATVHNNLLDIARDKAIDDAQRRAVEKAVGVMVTSISEVENYQLKLDRILSESQGFINGYQIVSEKRSGDQYIVVIEADVGTGRLKDRMTAINMILIRKAKPRLMVIFDDQAQKDAIAESSMAKFFLSQGFKVHASEVLKSRSQRSGLSDDRQAAKIARGYGAEILVIGRAAAASNAFNISGIEMHSNKVIVSVKVINADTGEILATDSETASAPGVKDDIKVIAEKASVTLARKIMDNVLERWSSELANTMTVNVVLSGLGSYEDLQSFKDLLSLEVKGFKALYQRSYSKGTVELDLEIRGNTQGVVDDLAAMKLDGRKIRILEIAQNSIRAQLSKK